MLTKTVIILLLNIGVSLQENFTSIIKCCNENYIIQNQKCVFNDSIKLNIPVYEHRRRWTQDNTFKINFEYYFEVTCVNYTKEHFMVLRQFSPYESFFVLNDGRLWIPDLIKTFGNRQFCLEYSSGLGVVAVICSPGIQTIPNVPPPKISESIGIIISVPFLFVTFLVNALLPEKNLYRMCFMSYVFALFGAYFIPTFCFIYAPFGKFNLITCRSITMSIYFFFLASFFWMNVIAFDIWLTFRYSQKKSIKRGNRNIVSGQTKRFLKYSIYPWGMSAVLVAMVVTLTIMVSPKAWYYPLLEGRCWFKSGIPILLYFFGPLGMVLTINIYLFGSTAWKIKQTRKQTAILRESGNRTHTDDSEASGRFKLYLKLLFAMGINWLIEFLQAFTGWNFLSILTFVCNGGLGIFIFFMFVFKRSIWNSLKTRYYMITGKAETTVRARSSELNVTASTSF